MTSTSNLDAVMVPKLIELARENVERGGRPFATIITKEDGSVLSQAVNTVAQTNDPTAHAEINAIREGSRILGSEHFTGCTFYILASPCPMCLAAMYYCSPERVVFVTTREDYGSFYRDDRRWHTLESMYSEVAKPWLDRSLPSTHATDHSAAALGVFERWSELRAANEASETKQSNEAK